MEEIFLKHKIYYYSRHRLYCAMLQACDEGLNTYHGNLTFNFYKALALALCNRFHESVPKLRALQLEDDFRLASLFVLVHIYELGELKDREAFPHFYSQIEQYKPHASALDLAESAYSLLLFENLKAAHELVEMSLRKDSNSLNLCLKGWIELQLFERDSKAVASPKQWFESSLNKNQNLDAVLGLSKCLCIENKLEEATALLNKAIIQYPDVHFPLVQKMETLFAAQEWDQFSETSKRVLSGEKKHLEALNLHIAKLIVIDAKYEEAAKNINKMAEYIEKYEPKNTKFLMDSAMLFSRICDRDSRILTQTYQLAELAVQVFPNRHEHLIELGYQCYLQGKFHEALQYYKLAMKINDSSISTLMEITLCELHLNGKTSHLKSQIEFLLEIQETEMPLLQYMLAKISDDTDEAKKLLTKALELQINKVNNYVYSTSYLCALNPDFLLMFIKEMMNLLPDSFESNLAMDTDFAFLTNTTKTIVKACPGLFTATYLLARLYYLTGKLKESQRLLNHTLNELEKTSSDIYLLLAQAYIKQGSHDTALQNLEMGLSHDFTIRDNALYHFLLGVVFKQHGKFEEAVKSLQAALDLFKIKKKDISDQSFSLKKVTIYEELVRTYLETNQMRKAADLLQESAEEFRGTLDESNILMLKADYTLLNGDVKSAVELLEDIKPQDPYYLKTKVKLATIMLERRRDKGAYLNCYKEMVKNYNSAEAYTLLGDAYLNILEPDDALKAYETAIKLDPSDAHVISRMGKALILTHQYKKAFEFYKDAIKTTNNNDLKIELVDLYIQVKEFDQAEALLLSEISNEGFRSMDDLESLKYTTVLLNLLSEVQAQLGNLDGALETLKNVAANQAKIRRRLSFEQIQIPDEELNLSVEVYLKISNLHISQGDFLQAINYQKDALSLKPNDTEVMAVLAKTYVQVNEMEKCQDICSSLLKLDPDNETALILMADVSFHKFDFEGALKNFSNLVTKDPNNWEALIRLIEILRRLGDIDQALHYLALAEQALEVPEKDTGFSYCSGLYHWYSGNRSVALKNFNNARQDSQWAKKALSNMIEICLNSDNELLGDNFVDNSDYKDSQSMALKTVERLLMELKQQVSGDAEYKVKFRLLSNFHLLAYKEKYQIEAALEDLVSMASEESLKDHVGVILGLATGYTILKQSQRAKTQLKRLLKQNWTYEDAEYLEKCWLLLADYYMQSSKYELASDLLKKILKYNKSSTKAYEYLGFISEKEQSYKEAVNYYSSAWKLQGKSNPAVGYKLALCFMKCKRYADAIETSQVVLSICPDYPKIKKEILDKSLSNLRA